MLARTPTPVDLHVSKKLRWRREALKVSQPELASRLGITFQQLQKYEHGGNRISAGRLFELAKALDTTIAYFYEGLTVTGARRGVAEEAVEFQVHGGGDVQELAAAFQRIEDPAVRKTILAMVKKEARAPRPAARPSRPKSRRQDR